MNNKSGWKMDGLNQIQKNGSLKKQQKNSIKGSILKTNKSNKPINPISVVKKGEQILKIIKVSFINYSNSFIARLFLTFLLRLTKFN